MNWGKLFNSKRNKRAFYVLASIVVFVTTYMLVLPALTIDEDTAIEDPAISNETLSQETINELETVADPFAIEQEREDALNNNTDTPTVSDVTDTTDSSAVDSFATQNDKDTTLAAPSDEGSLSVSPDEKIPAVLEGDFYLFNYESDEINVFVKAPLEAFPEGTTMKVTPVEDEDVLNTISSTVETENKRVKKVQAVDITFYNAEGEEIEPSTEIKVSLKSNLIKDSANTEVVHIDDEGKGSLVDQSKEDSADDEVIFESKDFSVYGVAETVETEITITNDRGEDETYIVSVTYGPEAKIPEGSTLSVKEFDKDSEEYENAKKAVLADKLEKNEYVDIENFGFVALDISIIDPYGKEIEPSAPVTVDMKIKELPGVEDLEIIKETLEIQHHVETERGIIVDTVFSGKEESSFVQNTNEQIVEEKKEEAVDPNSVSDEDFVYPELGENINPDEMDVSFETGLFSTYTISWNNYSYNIHYVDTNGNSLTPTRTPEFSNGYRFLIYDVEGYEYDSTHYGSRTGTSIKPLIGNYYGDRVYLDNNNYWQYLRNDIYVVYKTKPTPTTGGTPVIEDADPEDWPQSPDTPQFYKSSTNNGDGSNTVSLSITGGEEEYTKSTPADVIVVFDVSGSMNQSMSGQTRLARAKTAVNQMADTLLNTQGNDVRMALISFSTDAQVVQGFTDTSSTYTSKVNSLTQGGGTNWEKALKIANEMEVRSNAATFVIFVTDGDPTFRVSRGNVTDGNLDMYSDGTYQYYRNNNVFGTGSTDPNGRNLDFAVEQVKAIKGANKNFYAIGISDDVTKVQNLTTQGGVDASHAFIASDSAAMENAFKSITESIKSDLGFGDIHITDGITEMANVEMKVMHEVDPDSFTYYKVTSSGQQVWNPASEGVGLASYDSTTGSVKWDMGKGFQLEDGVTYTVTFRAWPSQNAYNLVADLNNGIKVYEEGHENSITDEERDQIVELSAPSETTPGSYTLKTNTDSVYATYSQTSSTAGKVTVSGDTDIEATYNEGTMQNMGLASQLLKIKKIFDQSLDPRIIPSVTLKLQRKVNDSAHQMSDYNVPGTNSPLIVLNDDNDWEYSFYVAPGLIIDGETLETGYQFTVVEPEEYLGDDTVRYDLIPEIVNPMVVNGNLQLIGDGDSNQMLTAINRTRSAVEIHKTLYDVDGTTKIYPDTEFTITGSLLGPDGQPFTSQETGAPVAYYLYDKNGTATTGRMHFPTTQNISFTLKAGEFIRFVNVPEGCTFVFQESSMPENYEFKELEAAGRQRDKDDPAYTYSIVLDDSVAHLVEGDTTISTTNEGIIGNTNYKLDFYNKRTVPLPDIDLLKKNEDQTQSLNGAAFSLYSDEELTTPVTTDGNGKPIKIVTGVKPDDQTIQGWYNIGLLPAGTYYLVETAEPAGYLLDETPVIITVEKDGNSYTVTATKNGKSVIEGPTADGLYTITVENKINLTDASATKVWKNADGSTAAPNGASVEYTLYADGVETGLSVTLDGTADETIPTIAGGYESEGWTAKFVNLTKYKEDGESLIVYTIAETTTYPGYTADTTDPVASGETIANTQVSTAANATKAWKNSDGSTTAPEGASVVFTLYSDGTATNYKVTLDGTADSKPTGTAGYESEAWKAEFINLPKSKIVDGEAVDIVYTIAETTTYPGYTPDTTDPVASGETITNTQGSTGIYASKVWKNSDESTTAPEGASVVFTLYSDGTATNYKVTLDGTADSKPTGTAGYESEAWKAEFINLPKSKIVDGHAVDIVYTIAETTTYPGYTPDPTTPVGSGSTITNKQVSTDADATKAWKNADGSTTAPQGGKVTFTLYADGAELDPSVTVTLDGTTDSKPTGTAGYESEAWKAEFINLPKSKIVDGHAVDIVYTIAETTTYPGYTPSTTEQVASGETITNTQEAVEVNAIKAWKNADGSTTPPEGANVQFILYADGITTDPLMTVELDGIITDEERVAPVGTGGYEYEAWKAKFINLPKSKIVDGEAVDIVYTIGESRLYPGYTPDKTKPVASGETITNSQDSVEVYALKVWENADKTTTAPEGATVIFTLLADGEDTEYTVTLKGAVDETVPTGTGGYESEAWKAMFINLPKYKADGTTEIVYTIKETTGYETYEGDPEAAVESGETIYNKQISTPIEIKKIGDWTETNTLSNVQFKLYSDEACTKQITKDGTGVDIGTEGIITTGSDGTAVLGTFVPGTYYLKEVAAADGYKLLEGTVSFTINNDGTIAYTTSNKDFNVDPGAVYELEDGGYGIYINNESGAALPMTGGTGTSRFYILGSMLIAGSLMYEYSLRRNRKRKEVK